ncbi:MAG: protein-disulfide reductase DsbD family protein [Phycisphaerales bacterium]
MVLAVILDHAEHWHTNLNQPIVPEEMGDFFPVPTTILLPEVEGLSFGAIQWPDPSSVPVDFLFTGNPVQYKVYGERAIIYIPIEIDDDAVVRDRAVEVTIKYQACDDTTCLPPVTS